MRQDLDPPRLLAVGDVHMTAPCGMRDALRQFYQDVLRFDCPNGESDPARITLLGVPRSGPRLMIDLLDAVSTKPMRRQALVQFNSLRPISEALSEGRIEFEWSSGWFFFDKRIGLLDPGGNWIELVSSHSW